MKKNLRQLSDELTQQGAAIRAALETMNKGLYQMPVDALRAEKTRIEGMKNRYQELKALYDTTKKEEGAAFGAPKKEDKSMPMTNELQQRLASNEYANAFAYALRNGLNRRSARADEKAHILLDTLTEAGNSGADGGFLVPEDIDHSIREKLRELGDLGQYFEEETVTAPTGWRVTDTAPTTGFTKISAEFGQVPTDDQPAFGKVPYSVDKYGLRLPVSNELANDNVANLFGYIARWYAKKLVITRNGVIMDALTTTFASPTDITAGVMAGVKKAYNVTLDPAISAGAFMLANQTSWDILDQIDDGNGRGLLQPDPTNAAAYKAFGRPVHGVADTVYAAKTIYVGAGKQFGTLFNMGGLELASTDIGGDAWKTDSTEFRGIVRLGFSVFDATAMAALKVGQ